jgi:hypothetical protein
MSLLDTASLIVTPNGYKEGKLYSVIPSDGSGDMSVVRATTATRVNSAGLVELVPYNLFSYSQDFSNAYWAKINTTLTGGQSGYDGSTNAFLLADTAANNVHVFLPSFSTSGQVTLSIYAKANSLNWIWLRGVQNSANVRAWFNLSTGTIGTVETNGTANIESVGNGWYRCSLTIANHQSGFEFYYGVSNANNVESYIGSGQSIFVQDAQLVEGSTAKDYQKTETRLNIPRLDYSNGTCPSLLVEPQRTNLIFPSNGSASNAFNGTFVANAATSPQGVNNASSFVSTGGASGVILTTLSTSAQSYSFSVYLKGSVNGQKVRVFGDLNGTIQNFTLTTEWERYEVTFTGVLGTQSIYLLVGTYFSPAETNLFYFYGAQLEVGNYVSSYIPTQGASVTRNADVISKTGISSLIGQTEGTLFFDLKTIANNEFKRISINGGSFVNSIFLDWDNTNNIYLKVINSGVLTTTILGAFNYAITNKIAIAYKNNDYAFYINGVLQGTNNSISVPSGLSVYEFSLAGNQLFEGNINAAALWKTRLTNTQLAQLTSI